MRKFYNHTCIVVNRNCMTGTDTVHGRIDAVDLTPHQVVALGVLVVVGVALLFAQEPMLHDAAHNFRHTAGITCH